MKPLSWEAKLGIALVVSAVLVYVVKFLVLGDPENTYYYVFNALGFLPLNVLLVTLILNQLLSIRAKRDRLQKLNMVIGTFFSTTGTELLTQLSDADPSLSEIRGKLVVTSGWTRAEFARVRTDLLRHSFQVDAAKVDLVQMRCFLDGKSEFHIRLLENPAMLEHATFTDLLRAIFHLTEELDRRRDLASLPVSDVAHIAGDLRRVYSLLAAEWLRYMEYLKNNYPYLFSLAMRTNPFDETASIIVS
jgi:hypothetical protein